MSLDGTREIVTIVGACVAIAATVLGAWFKWGRPKAVQAEAVGEAILGRPEVRDRSGAVIQPAQPGMVAQVATLTETVRALVDMNQRVDRVEGEVAEVKNRVSILEDARVEQVMSRLDSASAFSAIEAVAKSTPPDEGA